MPVVVKPLTDSQVKNAKPKEKPYKLSDGSGLYLLVKIDGARLWRLNYSRPITKKANTLALGVYPDVSLAEARLKRDQARKLIAADVDPSEQRKTEHREALLAASNSFEVVAGLFMAKQNYSEASITKAAWLLEIPFLKFGKRPIKEITPMDVLLACQIAEKAGTLEKANRMLSKCSQVFRHGVSIGACESDPTRDLRGALEKQEVVHHAALTDPSEVGLFLQDVEHYTGRFATVVALRIMPMLFTRPGELRAMKWLDLDLDKAQWAYTPPKTRKSTKISMIVPLPSQVVALLREIHPVTCYSIYVFPCTNTKLKPMSSGTINQALRRMGWVSEEVCGHGFRATARTILDEELDYSPDLIDMQLGHKVKDTNGRAYNRTWQIKKRTEMMQSWADYLDGLRGSIRHSSLPS